MAGRQTKAGLDYFELDCHMEDKVRLIQAEFGLKGFAVIVKLYQKIYGGFGYYCEWSEDSLLLFMSENGLPSDNKNLIQEIVSACVRRDIFSEELFKKFNILTSEGVQKRYLNATSRQEKIELKKEYLLISVPENSINVVINSISDGRNSINDERNSQSKGKESRVEERKEEEIRVDETPPISPKGGATKKAYFPNDKELDEAFKEFLSMRNKIKKPLATQRALTRMLNKIERLSCGDNELAIKILNRSTDHCWTDIYELKDDGNWKTNKSQRAFTDTRTEQFNSLMEQIRRDAEDDS